MFLNKYYFKIYLIHVYINFKVIKSFIEKYFKLFEEEI